MCIRDSPITATASKSRSLDHAFFGGEPAPGFMVKGRRRLPPVGRVNADGSGPETLRGSNKKHNKGNKRSKQRSGAGYA